MIVLKDFTILCLKIRTKSNPGFIWLYYRSTPLHERTPDTKLHFMFKVVRLLIIAGNDLSNRRAVSEWIFAAYSEFYRVNWTIYSSKWRMLRVIISLGELRKKTHFFSTVIKKRFQKNSFTHIFTHFRGSTSQEIANVLFDLLAIVNNAAIIMIISVIIIINCRSRRCHRPVVVILLYSTHAYE